jgi:hypothetical protein
MSQKKLTTNAGAPVVICTNPKLTRKESRDE